jgi:hypothetical protein
MKIMPVQNKQKEHLGSKKTGETSESDHEKCMEQGKFYAINKSGIEVGL